MTTTTTTTTTIVTNGHRTMMWIRSMYEFAGARRHLSRVGGRGSLLIK